GPIDDDASLADWPIAYGDLEPFYADAERLVGVAGDASANPYAAWRSGPYPMPPGPPMYGATLSTAAAERLGYHPYPAPTGVNSVPYGGGRRATTAGSAPSTAAPYTPRAIPWRRSSGLC